MKIIYIRWFFQFIWQSIKDLPYEVYSLGKFNLFKENWEDFKIKISLDKDPEIKKMLENINKL